jgi:hypothetical protein
MNIPERFINVNSTTIMWDALVITDQTVLPNRPDKLLHDKREKTCLLNDMALPDDSNVNEDTEKLSKYKDLETEVNRTWKVGTKFVSVTI